MFNKQECDIMIMALMYLKNDYTEDDLNCCMGRGKKFNLATCTEFQDLCHKLMEDLVGPTWDEEATTENLKVETAKRTRRNS
jgi:hypothetical protein